MNESNFKEITERLLKNPKYLDEIKKELTPYWRDEYNKYLSALIIQTLDKETEYRTIWREANKQQYDNWILDVQTAEYYIPIYAKRCVSLMKIQEIITGKTQKTETEKEQQPLIDLLNTSNNAAFIHWMKKRFTGKGGVVIADLIFAMRTCNVIPILTDAETVRALEAEIGTPIPYQAVWKSLNETNRTERNKKYQSIFKEVSKYVPEK